MPGFFKKALGLFVEFEEKGPRKGAASSGRAGAAGAGTAAPGADGSSGVAAGAGANGAAAAHLADAPEELSQHPDVARVEEAIALLSSLPLDDIPAEKARELILRTLEFAGLNAEELLGSFQRAEHLYRAQIDGEQARIEARRQQNQERISLLESALAEEKAQYEAEVTARTGRIDKATQTLSAIEKAVAFFVADDDGTTGGRKEQGRA